MLSGILEQMGCFMGWRKDRNNEATFFQRENNRLLKHASASWDNPAPFKWFLDRPDLCQQELEISLSRLKSLRGFEFWGARGQNRPKKEYCGWGWKDPRMSITGQLWLRAFSAPKIVRVLRNGVDVAASLKSRENYFLDEQKNKRPISTRCLSLEGAFLLWAEYVDSEEQWLAANPELSVLTCRYEDLLKSPEDNIKAIASFLGLTMGPLSLESIDLSRRYAFAEDSELVSFYSKVKNHPVMQRFAYDEIQVSGL